MKELVELVQQWSIDKGLDKADSRGQFLKIVEEVGEVAAALCRSDMDALKDGIGDVVVTLIIYTQQNDIDYSFCEQMDNPNRNEYDGTYIADIITTLSNLYFEEDTSKLRTIDHLIYNLFSLAFFKKLTLRQCLQAAYNEISGRTGKMVNGIFVKQEDLPKPEYDKGVWTKVNKNGSIAGYEGDAEKQGDLL